MRKTDGATLAKVCAASLHGKNISHPAPQITQPLLLVRIKRTTLLGVSIHPGKQPFPIIRRKLHVVMPLPEKLHTNALVCAGPAPASDRPAE